MKSFVFGVGIESVIRYDNVNSINKTKNSTAVPFINFTSIDPIKRVFGLEDSIRMKLLIGVRPKQLSVDSIINYREYAGQLYGILDKISKKKIFPNSKKSKMWKVGSANLQELDDLRKLVTKIIASDIEV